MIYEIVSKLGDDRKREDMLRRYDYINIKGCHKEKEWKRER